MSYILIALTLLSGEYTSLRRASLLELLAGHYIQAEVLARTAIESARSHHDPYAAALSYSDLGDALQAQGRFLEAEREYRDAISILNQQSERSHATAIVWRSLASDLTSEKRYREARAALKQAATLISKNRIQDPSLSAEVLNSLGVVQFDEGEIDKAASSFARAALLPWDPNTLGNAGRWEILNNLGRVYQIRHQTVKAEQAYSQSLHLAELQMGSGHPAIAILHTNLGSFYSDMGRFGEAEKHFQLSLAIFRSANVSGSDAALMHTLYELARTYVGEHQEARAEPLLAQATTIARKHTTTDETPEIAEIFDMYSRVLKDLSKASEADHLQLEARRVRAAMAFTVPVDSLR
jgi:tetratricopeptide (TPR) repeat protein